MSVCIQSRSAASIGVAGATARNLNPESPCEQTVPYRDTKTPASIMWKSGSQYPRAAMQCLSEQHQPMESPGSGALGEGIEKSFVDGDGMSAPMPSPMQTQGADLAQNSQSSGRWCSGA